MLPSKRLCRLFASSPRVAMSAHTDERTFQSRMETIKMESTARAIGVSMLIPLFGQYLLAVSATANEIESPRVNRSLVSLAVFRR